MKTAVIKSQTSKSIRKFARLKKYSHSICRDGFMQESDRLEDHFHQEELLICGDNLQALKLLQGYPSITKSIRLVYIDPPFGTRQTFNVSEERVATISRSNGGEVAYRDDLSGEAYLKFLRQRLEAIRNVMAMDGSIYVHIDCKIGHYVKCLMDDIFGARNFVNDIARIKCTPKNFNREGYGNVKDMILFYRKGKKAVWNDLRQPVEIAFNNERFRSVDENGRKYATTPLHAPGETVNGATGKSWRGLKPPLGRHWRYPPVILDELDRRGLIKWSSTGNPRKKIYADEVERAGLKIQDVWVFKDPQTPKYPTEKNLEMLKTIVANSSRPGDTVLDAFCGSGTTLVAARDLGRKWIGMDQSPVAISVCRKRLLDADYIHLNDVLKFYPYE